MLNCEIDDYVPFWQGEVKPFIEKEILFFTIEWDVLLFVNSIRKNPVEKLMA